MKSLEKDYYFEEYILKDSNGKIVDKITGLPKDLKDINLSNYVFNGRIENGEVKDKLTRLKKEIEDIRFSFMRNIKEEFFKEMSKEFKIKETVIKEIVKSSLNRMALYSKLSNQKRKVLDFESFISKDFNMSKETAETIYKLVENEVNFLKIRFGSNE